MVTNKRSEEGMYPSELDSFYGLPVLKDLKKDQGISYSAFKVQKSSENRHPFICQRKTARLPGKVLLPLGDCNVTEHLLVKLSSRNADEVVLSTSLDPRDDVLVKIAKILEKIFRVVEKISLYDIEIPLVILIWIFQL